MKVIARRLGVSPASVHLWTSDLVLTPAQRERIEAEAQALRAKTWREKNWMRRLAFQEEGRRRAREDDALHRAGCMLYWAEGSKQRNDLVFANSDLHMVRFFCKFLRESLGVPSSAITFRLNVYTGNGISVGEIEDRWLTALGLERSSVRKHTLDHFPTSSSGRKRNKLPLGVGAVRVYDTRLVQHIYGAIQEYAGFDEPRWLDGPPRKPKPAATGSADQ